MTFHTKNSRQLTNSFTFLHAELLDLYFGLCDGGSETEARQRLVRLRQEVERQECADSLVAYERYLELVARRLDDAGLTDRLTLLDDESFRKALGRNPSQPYALLGAALAQRRQGYDRRARQLLRRLAGSLYPERKLAQRLLSEYVLQSGGA